MVFIPILLDNLLTSCYTLDKEPFRYTQADIFAFYVCFKNKKRRRDK